MKEKFLSTLLAITAIFAIVFYAINCRPAWSPDSKKVAYIYSDKIGDEEFSGIAIYDLEKNENQSILEIKKSNKEDIFPYEVFWIKGGKEIIYVLGPTDEKTSQTVTISRYNLKTKERKKICETMMPEISAGKSLVFPVTLEKGRWLWISDGKMFRRLDIKTGKRQEFRDRDFIAFGSEKKVAFVEKFKDDKIVFGKIKDLFFYKEAPLFSIPIEAGAGEILPILAIPTKKIQFAYIKEVEEGYSLTVLDSQGKVVKEIALPDTISFDKDSSIMFASAVWDSNGESLWLPVEVLDENGEKYNAITEVNIINGSVSLIKFEDKNYKSKATPFYLSLSPDEKYLASEVMLEEGGVHLGLVDLTAKERKVTFIHHPATISQKSGSTKK